MKEQEKISVGFISLGCSKNLVDSQILAGEILGGGLELARDVNTADVILINTCAFIEEAREEAAENILSACAYKTEGHCRAVIVTGCMVARYKERLRKTFPDVDAFLGIDELDQIAGLIRRAVKKHARAEVLAAKGDAQQLFNPRYPNLIFTGGAYAYLKVADGCNHRCSYCAIPLIRGAFRSRLEKDLLKECGKLIDGGVGELDIIAQDVLRYGCDLSKSGKSKLPTLLKKIDALQGDFRYRLLYGYPSEVTEPLLEHLATSPHACKYLDLPIQHSHPDILRAMNRAPAVPVMEGLTQRLRAAVPGITLRTTCLVGFPGETEAHFQHLLDYLKASEFDHVGVFAYSPEEGTAAVDLPQKRVSQKVANDRCARLMALQAKIAKKRKQAKINTKDRALLVRQKKEGVWEGLLECQAPEVDGITRIEHVPDGAHCGQLLEVTITGVRGFDFRATCE